MEEGHKFTKNREILGGNMLSTSSNNPSWASESSKGTRGHGQSSKSKEFMQQRRVVDNLMEGRIDSKMMKTTGLEQE